jgi:hypothetical protein
MKIKYIFPISFSFAFALNRYHVACYKGNNSSKKKMSRNIQFLESNQENANGVLGFILNYAMEWWPF